MTGLNSQVGVDPGRSTITAGWLPSASCMAYSYGVARFCFRNGVTLSRRRIRAVRQSAWSPASSLNQTFVPGVVGISSDGLHFRNRPPDFPGGTDGFGLRQPIRRTISRLGERNSNYVNACQSGILATVAFRVVSRVRFRPWVSGDGKAIRIR